MRTTAKRGAKPAGVRLLPDRSGYLIERTKEKVAGFEDRRSLPKAARVQVARWAQRLAPNSLSREQRDLLKQTGDRKPSEKFNQRTGQSRELGTTVSRLLWRTLSPEQQRLVMNPQLKLGDRDYPLSTTELAALVDLDVHRVRHWADVGLLPHYRKGRARLFEAVAASFAFALHDSPQADRQFYSDLVSSPTGERAKRMAAAAAFATLERSDDPKSLVHELDSVINALTQATEELQARRSVLAGESRSD